MYHPAAALHQGSLRPVIENDFSQLPRLIAERNSAPQPQGDEFKDEQEPKQLSLF
jgi:DNA polymerase